RCLRPRFPALRHRIGRRGAAIPERVGFRLSCKEKVGGGNSPLKLFDKRTAQVLFTALAFVVALLFIYFAWRALIAFVFAVFFAYLLEAPVARLQTWLRGSRPAAIAVVYAVFLGLLVLVFSLLGPPIAQETQKLTQQAPEWANRITSRQIAEQVGGH